MCVCTEAEDIYSTHPTWASKFKPRFLQHKLLVVHLNWVAVATKYQSQGVGTLLMGRAVDDFYHVTNRTGIAALTLQPISVRAREFYKSLGFEAAEDAERPHMFLPAETVLDLHKSATESLVG